jgi:anthranilate phosphoribosyltransferase
MLRALLSGKDVGPRRDVVLLNAAAALATRHGDIGLALEYVRKSLDSGAAYGKMESLIAHSHLLASTPVTMIQ